jgi:hypothetical protein
MKKLVKMLVWMAFPVTILVAGACSENEPLPVNDRPGEAAGTATLSTEERNSLIFVREEEKLARDVYTFLYSKWKTNIFINISESEQKHMDAMGDLLAKYKIPDPVIEPNKFTNLELQVLYDDLVAKGSVSLTEALRVGATIEDKDIYDLNKDLLLIDNADIRLVYGSLLKGSKNHMVAFYSSIVSSGETYTPQYITQAEFDAVVK